MQITQNISVKWHLLVSVFFAAEGKASNLRANTDGCVCKWTMKWQNVCERVEGSESFLKHSLRVYKCQEKCSVQQKEAKVTSDDITSY